MTAINLYKFIQKDACEYHWHDEDVLLFINALDIKEFCDLLGARTFDDEGVQVTLKDGYICLFMKDICESVDILLTDVFEKGN